jgi:hypothetical protein
MKANGTNGKSEIRKSKQSGKIRNVSNGQNRFMPGFDFFLPLPDCRSCFGFAAHVSQTRLRISYFRVCIP